MAGWPPGNGGLMRMKDFRDRLSSTPHSSLHVCSPSKDDMKELYTRERNPSFQGLRKKETVGEWSTNEEPVPNDKKISGSVLSYDRCRASDTAMLIGLL
jgi:hypothetical protein